jgi:hypothetical protein
MSKRPLVLDNLTSCWLINMAAYGECLGATQADNFAVNSYISVLALLMNRKEDTQVLRAKGIINSAFCDKTTLYSRSSPRICTSATGTTSSLSNFRSTNRRGGCGSPSTASGTRTSRSLLPCSLSPACSPGSSRPCSHSSSPNSNQEHVLGNVAYPSPCNP